MIIKSISVDNFKNFKHKEIKLDNITLIRGDNGLGKSTLALDAILFCLYGNVGKCKLQDFLNKAHGSSYKVVIEFTIDKDIFKVTRDFPTKLTIVHNGKTIEGNTVQCQKYLDKYCGNREHFQKFRIIDSEVGANFLLEGTTAFKKILLMNSDQLFNKVRVKLLENKNYKQKFNKSNIVISYHHPSQKRMIGIQKQVSKLNGLSSKLYTCISDLTKEITKLESNVKYCKTQILELDYQLFQLQDESLCSFCKQVIVNNKEILEKQLKTKIEDLELQKSQDQVDVMMMAKALDDHKIEYDNINKRLRKVQTFKNRLETCLKQKQYKYTKKDVLDVDMGIKYLDRFSSKWLKQSLNTLTPIVDSIVEKIGFQINFIVDTRNQLVITLEKDGFVYSYDNLSKGQKLVVQIAFKLALLLKAQSTGIIIADDGISDLDDPNLEHIISLFTKLPFQLLFVLQRFHLKSYNIKVIDLT